MAGRIESAQCSFEGKNRGGCGLFLACSNAHKGKNGDLTPTEFCEKHPELKIDQVVEIFQKQKSLTPWDKMPLRSFSEVVSKGIYVIPGTDVCVFEGKDKRSNTCPNNPVRCENDHLLFICKLCPECSSIAPSSKGKLPEEYASLKHQTRIRQRQESDRKK